MLNLRTQAKKGEKFMKRKTLVLLLISIMVGSVLLASCSSESSSETIESQGSDDSEKGSDKVKHVRFVSVESDPPSVEAFNTLIEKFEAENPDIKIDLEILGADQLATKLTAAVAAGSPPDVSQADPKLIAEFAEKGYLEPVDDLIDSVGRDQWMTGSIVHLNGHDWSIPYAGTAAVLWYRKDLFEEYNVKPPTNWDEFIEAAKNLTLDTDGDGETDIYGISIPAGQNSWTENVFYMFMWANGQTVFDKDLNLTLNTPATLEALKTYAELASYGPPDIGTYSYYETIDAFGAGKTAMAVYEGRLLSRVATNNPEIEPHTAAVQWPAEKVEATEGLWKSYVVYEGSEVKEEAKKWLEFLTTSQESLQFLQTVPGHLLPPINNEKILAEYAKHPLLEKHPEDLEVILKSAEIAIDQVGESGAIQNGQVVHDRIVNPYMNQISQRNIISQMVQKVVLDGEDPQKALDWAEAEILKIIESMD